MSFNKDSRVKNPTILHSMKLGYQYLSLKDAKWDIDTNIFPELFHDAMMRINVGIKDDEVKRLFYCVLKMTHFEP